MPNVDNEILSLSFCPGMLLLNTLIDNTYHIDFLKKKYIIQRIQENEQEKDHTII